MKFCALMDMPPPLSTPTYHAHQHALLVAAEDVAKRSLDQAAAAVREKEKVRAAPAQMLSPSLLTALG